MDVDRGGAERFSAELSKLRGQPEPHLDFAGSFANVFDVTGVAVSTLGDLLGTETLSASDRQAARLYELQFDLGEGAWWDALRTGSPVLEHDLREPRHSWPAFTDAIREDGIASI